MPTKKKQTKETNGINEIADKIYQDERVAGIAKGEIKKVLQSLLEVIDDTLKEGEEINFVGHFKMYTTAQAAKSVTMSFGKKKGKAVKVKARLTPRASFSPALKRQMIEE
jgi:nucleoid DNA-binding protein